MMRLGVYTGALLVVATTVGWLLLRGVGDAGHDRPVARSDRVTRIAKDEASTRDLGAAPAPTYIPSARDVEVEPTASPAEHPGARSRTAPASERSPSEPTASRFDGRMLEEAGYSAHDVEAIRRRWEQAEAEVRATREPLDPDAPGVTRRDLKREQHEVDSAMRERLGDDDYDAGRYATGQDNRVEIHGVLEDSVAASAGLQEGDLLIEYEGNPIYTTDDVLELWRTSRELGATEIVVRISRDGRTYPVSVPRGLIGSFRGISVPPE